MSKPKIDLNTAVNQFAQQIQQRDPNAKIALGQSPVMGENGIEMETTLTIQASNGGVSRYSVWQNHDGTVGGARWM